MDIWQTQLGIPGRVCCFILQIFAAPLFFAVSMAALATAELTQ